MERKIEQTIGKYIEFYEFDVVLSDELPKRTIPVITIHTANSAVLIERSNIPTLITILQQFIGKEGKCYECKRDVVLAQDYNGRNYLLCTSCLDKLNKEFYE